MLATIAGAVRCWGDNFSGQLDVPSDLGLAKAVATGGWHTCAVVSATRTVRCWGTSNSQSDVPSDLGPVTTVAAGSAHTCAVVVNGTLVCFGFNFQGQATVPPDLGPVAAVALGSSYTCAVTTITRALRCWGQYDTIQNVSVPADLGPVTAVAAGGQHICAVTQNGIVRCWPGDTELTAVPSDLGPVAQLVAGAAHTCALTAAQTVRCWGSTLPFYAYDQTSVPGDLGPASAVFAGAHYTCAVTISGSLRCWGKFSDYNQTSAPSDLGITVAVPADGIAEKHACVVAVDGGCHHARSVCVHLLRAAVYVPNDFFTVSLTVRGAVMHGRSAQHTAQSNLSSKGSFPAPQSDTIHPAALQCHSVIAAQVLPYLNISKLPLAPHACIPG